MIGGAKPTRLKHKDLDYLKSRGFQGISAPKFPDEFPDNGLPVLNQNFDEPEGCTNFSTARTATALTGVERKAEDLEVVTHANARGGFDIRTSLDMARTILKWFPYFFNIRAFYPLDFFDAFRLAQMEGLPENRAISWGTPWFASWNAAAMRGEAVMPMPTAEEFAELKQNQGFKGMILNLFGLGGHATATYGWHNSVLDRWQPRNGIPMYRNDPHQGTAYGENGFVFFTREVIDEVMKYRETVAFVLAADIGLAKRIDTTLWQKLVSFISGYLPFRF